MSKNSTMYQRWTPTPAEIADDKRKGNHDAMVRDNLTECILHAANRPATETEAIYNTLSDETRNIYSLATFQRLVRKAQNQY